MKPLTTRPRPNLPVMTFCKGKEVDAFQVAAVRARDSSEPIPSRDQIYIEWLNERLTAQSDRPQAVFLVPNSVRVDDLPFRSPAASPSGGVTVAALRSGSHARMFAFRACWKLLTRMPFRRCS